MWTVVIRSWACEAGDVGAVDVVGEGEEGLLGLAVESGVAVEELSDGLLVFFRFEAAGGVEEGAAGPEVMGGGFEQAELLGGQAVDFLGLQAPAEVEAASDDAGVGAWGVEQNPVEGR